MAIYKVNGETQLYVVGVEMDNRSPEEISRDAALQIIALFDKLAVEKKAEKELEVTTDEQKTC